MLSAPGSITIATGHVVGFAWATGIPDGEMTGIRGGKVNGSGIAGANTQWLVSTPIARVLGSRALGSSDPCVPRRTIPRRNSREGGPSPPISRIRTSHSPKRTSIRKVPELKALREGRKTLERPIPRRRNRHLQAPLARAAEEGDTSPARKGTAVKGIKARSRFPCSSSSDSSERHPAKEIGNARNTSAQQRLHEMAEGEDSLS